jgi:hypothetical protein
MAEKMNEGFWRWEKGEEDDVRGEGCLLFFACVFLCERLEVSHPHQPSHSLPSIAVVASVVVVVVSSRQ